MFVYLLKGWWKFKNALAIKRPMGEIKTNWTRADRIFYLLFSKQKEKWWVAKWNFDGEIYTTFQWAYDQLRKYQPDSLNGNQMTKVPLKFDRWNFLGNINLTPLILEHPFSWDYMGNFDCMPAASAIKWIKKSSL